MDKFKAFLKICPIIAYCLVFLVFFVKLCIGMLLWQEVVLGGILCIIALFHHKLERNKDFLSLQEEYKKTQETVNNCKADITRLSDSINSIKLKGIRG